MTSPLSYRPRSRPLQLASPGASVAYLGSFVLAAFVLSSPPALAAVALAAGIAGIAAGVGRAAGFGLRIGAVMALALVVVNGLVTARGQTVLARLGEWPLLGRVDVTGEALAAGGVIGLRAMAVTTALAVYSAAVDPDRVLRAVRPLARRSALTAGLVSRMVPLAISDASRLSEAARLRGPGAATVGRGQLARRLLAGSLDRSVDVAATLELRGIGLPDHRSFRERLRSTRQSPRPRHDRRFRVAALLVAAAALAAALTGADAFRAYPLVEWEPGPAMAPVLAVVVLAGLAPARLARRAKRRGSGSRSR